MARRLIPAVLFMALAACTGGARVPAPCGADVTANEYAVYSAAIEEVSNGSQAKTLVILGHTEDASDPESLAGRSVRSCEEYVPGAEKSLLDSYRERNRSPVQLSRNFTLGTDYLLVSESDFKTIPADEMRMRGFHAKYRDAFGVVGMSRPGFDAGMNTAVLYIWEGYCGLGCGRGACLLLVRERCGWKVKEKGSIWMS